MAKLTSICDYCDDLLSVSKFKDYAPNGLQIEGRAEISNIVAGVTANQALIDEAIEKKADAILVHHGFFWKNEDPRIIGIKAKRIKKLMQNEVSLIAYHLPLDAHLEVGNNVQLAKLLGIDVDENIGDESGEGLLMRGAFNPAISVEKLRERIEKKLKRAPLVLPGGNDPIGRIALCSGAAQGYIDQAFLLGVDAYISGEVSENTTHFAKEAGITYVAAGHHATERYGVQSLLDKIKEKFEIRGEFIDVDNPV